MENMLQFIESVQVWELKWLKVKFSHWPERSFVYRSKTITSVAQWLSKWIQLFHLQTCEDLRGAISPAVITNPSPWSNRTAGLLNAARKCHNVSVCNVFLPRTVPPARAHSLSGAPSREFLLTRGVNFRRVGAGEGTKQGLFIGKFIS